MKLKLLTAITMAFAFLISCQAIKTVKMIYADEADYQDYASNDKSIRFVSMVHISTKHFYADVEKIINESKNDGYVLFYEYVDFDKASESEQRKLKKLVGFIPSPQGYQAVLDKMDDNRLKAQDNEQFMNLVNDQDFNVDVQAQDVINEYEKRYGTLVLTEEDLNTPIDEAIEPSEPKKQTMDILLNYRNDYLAAEIQESDYSKIIIIYGANHEKGLIKDLKKLDKSWKKVK